MTAYEHEDVMSCHGLYEKKTVVIFLLSLRVVAVCVNARKRRLGREENKGKVSFVSLYGGIFYPSVRYILNCLCLSSFFPSQGCACACETA